MYQTRSWTSGMLIKVSTFWNVWIPLYPLQLCTVFPCKSHIEVIFKYLIRGDPGLLYKEIQCAVFKLMNYTYSFVIHFVVRYL